MTRIDNYYNNVNLNRFWWQTKHPYVSLKEQELLENIEIFKNFTVLEVGCGEGANIYNMQQMDYKALFTGLDISKNKIDFAQANISDCKFICGNALELPFENQTFDLVFCKDLLHHIDNKDRSKAIDEMYRVCKTKGKIVIIEGNGNKLTNFLFSIIVPIERGMRETTPENLNKLFEIQKNIRPIKIFSAEPSNFFRVVYHYSVNKHLYNNQFFNIILDTLSLLTKKVIRKKRWAYTIYIYKIIHGSN